MTRTFITTVEQDAALAWRAAQLGISEDALMVRALADPLKAVVAAYRDSEGARVYDAYTRATPAQRDAAKTALGLNA